MNFTEKEILDALSKVAEPDLHKDIVQLGLVDNIKEEGGNISFRVQVSNPAMHSKKRMEEACVFAIQRAFGNSIEVDVNVIPMKEDKRESQETRKTLPGVKNIIAVASGKGGVGKSTVAANLAVGLANKGFKVGMIDADVYGPSMPTMFNIVHEKPSVVDVEGKQYMKPVEAYGVKILSIGFFADQDQAIVWRGAMATKALSQILNDAWWGDLDYMVIDLPPGTGDIHLSIVQAVPLTGAVIVSTPQEVALADARKGVSMFQMESINVPVLGIIENMAWFTPEELPDNKYYIFGKDGAANLAEKLNVPLLGQLPLYQSIRESGDAGRPVIMQDDSAPQKAMSNIVDKVVSEVEHRNNSMPATERVKITKG